MTTFPTSALTAEQLSTIASDAVAEVARQKITTSKGAGVFTLDPEKMLRPEPKAGGLAIMAGKRFNYPDSSVMNQQLAGSVLSLEEARRYFKEAFNKVRKGR